MRSPLLLSSVCTAITIPSLRFISSSAARAYSFSNSNSDHYDSNASLFRSQNEREILQLAPQLTNGGKVANRIMRLAEFLFLGSEEIAPVQFVELDRKVQAAILLANSILGNFNEVVGFCDDLAGPNDEKFEFLSISPSPDFQTAILKSFVKCRRLKIAQRLLSLIPNPTSIMVSLVVCALVTSNEANAAVSIARRYFELSNTPISRRSLAYLDAAHVGAEVDSSLTLLQTRDAQLEYLQYYCGALISLSQYSEARRVLETMVQLYRASGALRNPDPRLIRQRQDRIIVTHDFIMRSYLAEAASPTNNGTRIPAATILRNIETVFENLRALGLKPNVFCYTTLINAYYKYAGLERVAACYREMTVDSGVLPDQAVYNLLIRAYTLENFNENAMQLFEEMVETRGLYANVKCLTSVMGTLSMMGDMESCVGVFRRIEACGHKPDTHLFHVVMSGYAKASDVGNVLAWYDRLLSSGLRPNVYTYTIVMSVISRCKWALVCIDFFRIYVNFSISAVNPEATRRWFERVFSSTVKPNIHTYTLLIHDRAKRGDLDAAMYIYKDLLRINVKPTAATYTTLLDAYINYGVDGDPSFDYSRSTASLNSSNSDSPSPLETGQKANSYIEEAFNLCHEMMNEESRPDVAVYHVVMRMFVSLGRVGQAILIYEQMLQSFIHMQPVPENNTSTNNIPDPTAPTDKNRKKFMIIEPDETMYMTVLSLYIATENYEKVNETINRIIDRAKIIKPSTPSTPPTITALQSVLQKLAQIMMKQRRSGSSTVTTATAMEETADLFLRVFNEFFAVDSTGADIGDGVEIAALTTELYSWLVRVLVQSENAEIAAVLFVDMARRGIETEAVDSATRNELFLRLSAGRGADSGDSGGVDAVVGVMGASFVGGSAGEDWVRFEQAVSQAKAEGRFNGFENASRILQDLNDAVESSKHLSIGDDGEKSNVVDGIQTAQRNPIISPGIPASIVLSFLDTFAGTAEDIAQLRNFWILLITHAARPELNSQVVLTYVGLLTRHKLWSDAVDVLTRQTRAFGWSKQIISDGCKMLEMSQEGGVYVTQINEYWENAVAKRTKKKTAAVASGGGEK
ncbi:hypothetical protein HK100_012399 [Physocladia obscura]|uniref:Uncharacterized protein n=1 Tax=Physocladia obscura TaxID=109957 RepID=A0AAD5SZW7_9FUNG|nr:hypothetical protein HK100_012399 [Physocladia obscura]